MSYCCWRSCELHNAAILCTETYHCHRSAVCVLTPRIPGVFLRILLFIFTTVCVFQAALRVCSSWKHQFTTESVTWKKKINSSWLRSFSVTAAAHEALQAGDDKQTQTTVVTLSVVSAKTQPDALLCVSAE